MQSQAPVFVCGLVLDPAQTGFFSWGWAVAGQAVFLLAINLREVLLPTFTKLENNTQRRSEVALKAAHVMTALLCVACGAQALLAELMIKLLLPAKWLPAVPLVVVSSLGLVLQGLWISGMAWLNASGRYRLLLKMSALQVVLAAGSTWIGVILGGMLGATLGCALATLTGAIACVLPMGGRYLLTQAWSWLRPLGLSAFIWLPCRFFSHGHGPILQISVSLFFIFLVGWIWWREDKGGLKIVLNKLSDILKRFKPAVRGIE